MKLNVNQVVLFILLLLWGTNLSTSLCYILCIVIFMIALCVVILRRVKIKFSKTEDYIALAFIVVWFYGLILGLLKGNKTEYVNANFAGMVCYVLYFVFTTLNLKREQISKILLIGGFMVSLIVLLRVIFFFSGYNNTIINILIGEGLGSSSTGQFRVYFTTMTVAYPLLGASLVGLLFTKKVRGEGFGANTFRNLFLFVLTVTVLAFFASSKGFVLGALFLIFTIPFTLSLKSLLQARINYAIFILLIILILLLFFMSYYDYLSIIEMMFSEEDGSNIVRYNQLAYMLDDITLLGKGLGATVPGVIRSQEAPYGFELTYVNLIHKFGMLSIILFISWIYMYIKMFRLLLNNCSIYYSVMALSAMAYMFPSIGNPLLMHPSLVALNCAALYFLRFERYENKRMFSNL